MVFLDLPRSPTATYSRRLTRLLKADLTSDMLRRRLILWAVLLSFGGQGLGLALAAHQTVDHEHHGSHDGGTSPCPICMHILDGQQSTSPTLVNSTVIPREFSEPIVYVVADGFSISIHLRLSQRGPPALI